jgi:hypothetical protein
VYGGKRIKPVSCVIGGKGGNFHPTPQVSTKLVFVEYPLRYSMDLVKLGARSMDLVGFRSRGV